MSLVLPKPVLPPARLRVVHAAGRVEPSAVRGGVETLVGAGFEVVRDTSLGGSTAGGPGYLAGPDPRRARDLLHAICAPDVDAVVCARGGYGAMRIVDRLPAGVLAESPKWIVGYSDITALHLWALREGVASIHGPMAAGLPKHGSDGSIEALVATLAGEPPPLPGAWIARHDGLRGRMIGGNLSMLAALRPTSLWPDLRGAILFIEEVGEPLYRIDRMLRTLLLAGGLDSVAAFAIGQLTRCGDGGLGGDGRESQNGDGGSSALELVLETLGPLGKPIVHGLAVGHDTPNLSFVHGADYVATERGLEPAPPPVAAARSVGRRRATRAAARRASTEHPEAIVANGVAAGVCSGAQLHVSVGAEVVLDVGVGTTAWSGAWIAPVDTRTLFDIASVTKAICTAVLAHKAIEVGAVTLDDRCPVDISVDAPTLRDLLRHTSGLPAHEEVFRQARRAADPFGLAAQVFSTLRATSSGPGAALYSDVGYVALGRWVETLLGADLRALLDQHIVGPLALDRLTFGPLDPMDAIDAAATERCPPEDRALQGVVHDENCQVLGGAAGHAGLFASAHDVGTVARSLLGFGPRILTPESVSRMWDLQSRVEGGTYTLGWDTPSGPRSNAGARMTRDSTVGHLGFTGCSLWVDRARELVIVLNTNRVHPGRDNATIRWLRPVVHDAVLDMLAL